MLLICEMAIEAILVKTLYASDIHILELCYTEIAFEKICRFE